MGPGRLGIHVGDRGEEGVGRVGRDFVEDGEIGAEGIL